jgi:SAM-dependent methyltransferase
MARTEVHHPLFARFYAWMSPRMEKAGYGERRGQLLAGLSGRVLEVGAGNGMNFAHYPPEVMHLLAVEPEPHLRALAHDKEEASVTIEVVDATADHLPPDDATFDAIGPTLGGGDHAHRDARTAIENAGFTIMGHRSPAHPGHSHPWPDLPPHTRHRHQERMTAP